MPQGNLPVTYKEWHSNINTFTCLTSKQTRMFRKMIHESSYLISPQTPSFSVCFPLTSWNCTIVNTLGKMGSVIPLVSISETVFFLSLWGSQFAVRLSTQWYVQRFGGNYELSSRCRSTSSDCKRQYFKRNWKTTHSVLLLRCMAMQLFFLSAAMFFPGLIVSINMFSVLWGAAECRTTAATEPKAVILKGKGVLARSRVLSHSV